MPLILRCSREYFVSVVKYAKSLGGKSWESFKSEMKYLGGNPTPGSNHDKWGVETHLFKDFAPYSFEFARFATRGEYKGKLMVNGGLICHGANSSGVGFPECSVTLSPQSYIHWQCHH